ncbi:hypothetical protein IAU59_007266 [Kwoniella sp. CBS 9459]
MVHFHSLTDEFLRQLGTYLLPIQTPESLKTPSFTPHWLNSPLHIFDRRPSYRDYCSLRSVCHRMGYLLKPVKDDLMVEVDSKEYWWKLVGDAPEEVLQRVVRLRINFTLDADDDPSTESERYWTSFTSFLLKLPNLVELYLTATPFCYHPGTGQEFALAEPDLSEATSIVSFANEVSCRVCAEHLSNAFSVSGVPIKHLKTTSDDSSSRHDTIEPYDIFLYATDLETLYLKTEGLDTDTNQPFEGLADSCPNLKNLIFSAFGHKQPHRMMPKASLACTRQGDGWRFVLSGEGIRDDLADYADNVGLLTELEVFDPSFFITFPNIINDFPAIPAGISSAPQNHKQDVLSEESDPSTSTAAAGREEVKKAFMKAYKAARDEALVAATRVMKAHVPSLREMNWWQMILSENDDAGADQTPAPVSASASASAPAPAPTPIPGATSSAKAKVRTDAAAVPRYLRYTCHILPDRLASGEWQVRVDEPIPLSDQTLRNSDGAWMPDVEDVSDEQARALGWIQ